MLFHDSCTPVAMGNVLLDPGFIPVRWAGSIGWCTIRDLSPHTPYFTTNHRNHLHRSCKVSPGDERRGRISGLRLVGRTATVCTTSPTWQESSVMVGHDPGTQTGFKEFDRRIHCVTIQGPDSRSILS